MSLTGADNLRLRLQEQGLDPSSWANQPGFRYGTHTHDYDKVIVVVAGAIDFGVVGLGSVSLAPGDRLDLPAAFEHDAVVGPDGVTCLEAHLPAGTLTGGVASRGQRW